MLTIEDLMRDFFDPEVPRAEAFIHTAASPLQLLARCRIKVCCIQVKSNYDKVVPDKARIKTDALGALHCRR